MLFYKFIKYCIITSNEVKQDVGALVCTGNGGTTAFLIGKRFFLYFLLLFLTCRGSTVKSEF